jgi:hypothetical protein
MLSEYLDLWRSKKQEKGEECIIRILTFSTINSDGVAVGYVGDVSEEPSAYILGLS